MHYHLVLTIWILLPNVIYDKSFLAFGKLPSLKKLNVANTDIGFDTIDILLESRDDLEVIEFEN